MSGDLDKLSHAYDIYPNPVEFPNGVINMANKLRKVQLDGNINLMDVL